MIFREPNFNLIHQRWNKMGNQEYGFMVIGHHQLSSILVLNSACTHHLKGQLYAFDNSSGRCVSGYHRVK